MTYPAGTMVIVVRFIPLFPKQLGKIGVVIGPCVWPPFPSADCLEVQFAPCGASPNGVWYCSPDTLRPIYPEKDPEKVDTNIDEEITA